MSSLTVFIFRILLVIGGFILIYIIGKPMVETIQYRFAGEHLMKIPENPATNTDQEGLYIVTLLQVEAWIHWMVMQNLP